MNRESELAPIRHISPEPIRATPTEQPIFNVNDERQRQVLEKLEQGYEQAVSEEGFRRYLDVVSKFWQYSPRNMMLIYSQRPDATLVNSYKRWGEMGRQVQRGAQGIRIFYPQHRFIDDEDEVTGEKTKRKVLTGFGIGNVFDYRDTAGDPLPEPPTASDKFGTSDVAEAIDRRLSLNLLGRGFRLEKGDCLSARGYFKGAVNNEPHTIRLSERLNADDGRLKTFLHESAHFLAGHHEQGAYAREDLGRKELEAEGASFAAMNYWGMDTSEYSFSYMGSYGRTVENLKQSMPVIAQVTRQLIESVEGEQADGEEAWL